MIRFLTIILLFSFKISLANKILVGPNEQINRLSVAVQKARNGDTIILQKGKYSEGNIIINKSICLLGAGLPILDGAGKNEILTLSGHNIIIKGIQFANSGYSSMNDLAALKLINASKIIIEDNHFVNTIFAIHVSNATNSVIRKNVINGTYRKEHISGNGIHLWKCENMTIEGNTIKGHRDGIYFEFVTESMIRNNKSENNVRYGLHFMFSHNDTYRDNIFRNNGAGVAVMYSRNVRMEKNLFEKNWGSQAYGLLLKDISDSHIKNNQFFQNTVAIHMEGTSRSGMEKNIFKSNGWAVKVQASCDDNYFNQNNFLGNTFDIATNGTMSLNKFNNNYWDKYEGYDINKDGVGDIPYHPVSMYSMIIEQNPVTLMLMRSFIVSLLDKAEKAIPSLTPESLVDHKPMIKPNKL